MQVTGYVQYDIMYKLWKHEEYVFLAVVTYVILALKRQSQDPWGSLGSQSNLFGKLQAREKACLRGGGWYS